MEKAMTNRDLMAKLQLLDAEVMKLEANSRMGAEAIDLLAWACSKHETWKGLNFQIVYQAWDDQGAFIDELRRVKESDGKP